MRETVTSLERADAILVGLCVEHVLERHQPEPPRTVAVRLAVKREPVPSRRRHTTPRAEFRGGVPPIYSMVYFDNSSAHPPRSAVTSG
jgi:hypothetical protein